MLQEWLGWAALLVALMSLATLFLDFRRTRTSRGPIERWHDIFLDLGNICLFSALFVLLRLNLAQQFNYVVFAVMGAGGVLIALALFDYLGDTLLDNLARTPPELVARTCRAGDGSGCN